MPKLPVRKNQHLSSPHYRASVVLENYRQWLEKKYGYAGTYLTNARSFLRKYKAGSLQTQIELYGESKSRSLRSLLNRFATYLDQEGIDELINDLNGERKLPRSNIFVKLFLLHIRDRLRGELSASTYATVLNQYFAGIEENPGNVNKHTAERFIYDKERSDYTKRLYKAILKSFCEWVATYRELNTKDLNNEQRIVKRGLQRISLQSLREIVNIKVRSPRSSAKGYHKESLSKEQRSRLLKICNNQRDRAIVALMAWNGLRTVEVTRLNVGDCNFRARRLDVWGKGRSSRSRETIVFFKEAQQEVRKYLRIKDLKKGKLFPGLKRADIDKIVNSLLSKMKLRAANRKYSPHSLRHTAGQLLYDQGVRLEFVQKTLRHSVMETTKVYAQRAIDRNYFKSMARH